MGQSEKSALKRFGRGALSLLISGAIAYGAEKPYLIALAPLFSAVAKWLRSKFGLTNVPI